MRNAYTILIGMSEREDTCGSFRPNAVVDPEELRSDGSDSVHFSGHSSLVDCCEHCNEHRAS
jgi:hypothetical protein